MAETGETADREVLYGGRHVRFVRRGGWEYVERPHVTGIVGIVAVTDAGELVLVEQYRPPVSANVIELPAGLVGDQPGQEGEALLDAAGRELEEETGFRGATIEPLVVGAPSAGISSEITTLVRARGLTRVGPGGGDAHERITVHVVPLAQVERWLAARAAEGTVIDLKVYAALHFVRREQESS